MSPALLVLFSSECIPRRAIVGGAPVATDALVFDAETVAGMRDFATGWPAQNPDRSVNARSPTTATPSTSSCSAARSSARTSRRRA
jgi:hypothetical protein